ncbi:MAG: hypothetical protein HZB38_08170 [Planctomycetes bacterium]|nr:hypothetical protein [Planctomycetota bacterium]
MVLGWVFGRFMNVGMNASRRVRVSANFAEIGVGPWRGLVLNAWASGAGDQITGETATLTLPPVGAGRAGRSSDTIEIDLTKSPPGIKRVSGPVPLAYSAGGLASWVAGAPTDQRTAVDAVSRAVFQQIEGPRYGAATGKIEQSLHQLGGLLGGQSQRPSLVEIKRYPRPVSTAEFFGPFCALFLPPVLVWMVYRHRRNMRRR